MPVETCSGRVSWSDDIYAFGMTALEMFSFKHPYYYSKTAFQVNAVWPCAVPCSMLCGSRDQLLKQEGKRI